MRVATSKAVLVEFDSGQVAFLSTKQYRKMPKHVRNHVIKSTAVLTDSSRSWAFEVHR